MSRKVEMVRLAPEPEDHSDRVGPSERLATDVFRTEAKKPKLDRETLSKVLGRLQPAIMIAVAE
jgi:hypothetical protein